MLLYRLMPKEGSMNVAPNYPGTVSKYIVVPESWVVSPRGDWEYYPANHLDRCLEFIAMKADALFRRIVLLGNQDGSLRILVECASSDISKVKDFFLHHGIGKGALTTESIKDMVGYKTRSDEETVALYNLLFQFNAFEPAHRVLTDKLIQGKDWRKVTPLPIPLPSPVPHPRAFFFQQLERFSLSPDPSS